MYPFCGARASHGCVRRCVRAQERGALAAKAARYLRGGETFTWKPISETDLRAMVPGVGSADRDRNIRAARKHAVALLN